MTSIIVALLILSTSITAYADTSATHSYEVSATTAGTDREKPLHLASMQACAAKAARDCEERHGRARTASRKAQRRCQVATDGAKTCEMTCSVECHPVPQARQPQDLEAPPEGPQSTID